MLFSLNQRPNMRTNIWVLCRPCLLPTSSVFSSTAQFIAIRTGNFTWAFIHAENNHVQRRILWQDRLQIPDHNICCIGTLMWLWAHTNVLRAISVTVYLQRNFTNSWSRVIFLILRQWATSLRGPLAVRFVISLPVWIGLVQIRVFVIQKT